MDLLRVKDFTFVGVWFDEQMIWRVHVDKIVEKGFTIINSCSAYLEVLEERIGAPSWWFIRLWSDLR